MPGPIVSFGAVAGVIVSLGASAVGAQQQVKVTVSAVPNPISAGSCTRIWADVRDDGQASGKRQHGPIVVTKMVGTASPQIFQACTTNEVLKSVVVNLPGGEEGSGYTIKLSNATVSEVKQYTEVLNGQAMVLEDVSFTFQKIEVQDPGTKTMATDDWMGGK